jgi:hypothetical protein
MGTKQPSVSPNMTAMDAAPMTPMSPVDQRLAGLQDRMSTMTRTQMPQADTSAFSLDQIFGKWQSMKPQIWVDFGTGLPSVGQVQQTPQEVFMPQATPETPIHTAPLVTDTAVADLVADIKNVVAEGREVEISKLKELYPEYANLWDDVLQDLVIDLQNVVREGREVTPERVLELYPELAGQQEVNKFQKPQRIVELEAIPARKRTKEEAEELQRYRNQIFPQEVTWVIQWVANVWWWIERWLDKMFGIDPEQTQRIQQQQRQILFGDMAEWEAFKWWEEVGTIVGTAALTAPIWLGIGWVKTAIAIGSALWLTDYLIYKWVKQEDPDVMEAVLAWSLWALIPWAFAWAWPAKNAIMKWVRKTEALDDIVMKVIQGTDKNVNTAKKALQLIDVEDITTYKWLNNALDAKKRSIIALQDEYLSELWQELITPETAKIKRRTKDVSGNVIETQVDFVQRWLDDLTEIYTKLGDDAKLEVIEAAKRKYASEWLTLQEINTIARKYSEDGKSAFSATWDPLTWVWAQRSEATRKWLKETVRERLPNEWLKELDEAYHAISDTQILIDKAVEWVQKLKNKLPENRLFTQAAAKLVEILDMLSLGAVKWTAKWLLWSNVWQKTMNWGNIEAMLAKNLKKIQKMAGKKDISIDELKSVTRSLEKGIKESVEETPLPVKWWNVLEDSIDNVRVGDDMTPAWLGQRSLNPTNIDDIVPPARTSNMDIRQPSAMLKAPDEVKPIIEEINALRKWQPKIWSDWIFKWDDFISMNDVVARERFDIPNLEKISFWWSDRDVYNLWNGDVLKVAKTPRWLAQNQMADYYAASEWLIPEIKEIGRNYVVFEKVWPPDANTKKMVAELKKIPQPYRWQPNYHKNIDKFLETMEKYGYPWEELRNYWDELLYWDMSVIRNWGTKNWTPILLDEGSLNGRFVSEFAEKAKKWIKNLDDPEFKEIYELSKKARKIFGDLDSKTMYWITWLFVLWSLFAE